MRSLAAGYSNVVDSERANLTRREIEVLKLVASGKADKEIATALQISVRTVRYHISNIFRKADVSTRAQLIVVALKRQG
jgi:two-component system, NarL family, response regulator DegU